MRAYRVAYDGRGFYGFQRQPDVPTVEDAILDALESLDVTETRVPPGYSAAGRTDAGVSALAQTVAFEAPDWLTPHALNGQLPDAVWSWAAADVPGDFHAQHDAQARTYRYSLPARGCDEALARDVLELLSGRHDFHNLTPDSEGTVRSLETSLAVEGDVFVLTVTADGFPRNLVRRVAELVRAVGSGEAGISRVECLLGPDPVDGAEGVPPAPPYPLVLADVEYDVSFEVDEDAAASTRRAFDDRRWTAAARAHVTGFVADSV